MGVREQQEARRLINRKLAGKSIILNEDILRSKGFNAREVRLEFRRLLSVPAIRRGVGKVAVEKTRARELGFRSLKEFRGSQKRTGKPLPLRKRKGSPNDIIIGGSRKKQIVQRPASTLRALDKPKGFFQFPERISQRLSGARGQIRTQKLSGKKISPLQEAKLVGLTATQTVVDFGVGVKQLPGSLIKLARNPKNIITGAKALPSAVKKSGEEFGQLLRVSPNEALAKVGTEIVLLKGTSKGFKAVGKLSSNVATRISPKFVGSAKSGTKLVVRTSKGKKVLEVVSKLPREKLTKQARLGGKKVTAVSVQADSLVNLLKRRKLIRKPIPNEAKLPKGIRNRLNKFDEGKLSPRQILDLDRDIRKLGRKGLLERSFFADPRGRIRVSRSGIGKNTEATFMDYLTEDLSFKSPKPQILVFPDTEIAKLPKALQKIQMKLKKNIPLTKAEADKLLKFQLKTSGKFKPLGFISKESEITLAPGEIIKRLRISGKTIINGKSVNIVEVKVVKATARTKSLLKKARAKKLNKKEFKELKRRLVKETGFKSSVTSSSKLGKKFLSPRRALATVSTRAIRKRKRIRSSKPISRKKKTSKTSRGKTSRGKTSRPIPRKPSRGKTSKPVSRPSKTSRPAKTSRPGKPARPIRPVTPIKSRIKKRKVKKKKKKIQRSYNVFARPLKKTKKQRKPKLIKINKVPLSRTRAKDLRNYVTDTSLARTGKIKATKGKPKKPKLKVPRGYAKRTTKKFRRYRIVKGKKKALPKGKVIERRKSLLDTRQEKKKITLRRRIKQLSKPVKRKRKKKK